MAVKRKEYFMSLDNFNRPAMLEGDQAVALLIARLILLEPGSDPLHPGMGVGIKSRFRYGDQNLTELQQEIQTQIANWLPEFSSDVAAVLTITPDKVLNIEVSISDGSQVYKYSISFEHTLQDILA